jgi:hypothetical protein
LSYKKTTNYKKLFDRFQRVFSLNFFIVLQILFYTIYEKCKKKKKIEIVVDTSIIEEKQEIEKLII